MLPDRKPSLWRGQTGEPSHKNNAAQIRIPVSSHFIFINAQ